MNTLKGTFAHFGEIVEGYSIPVLNEREIRAAAGLLFVPILIALLIILTTGNFVMIKLVITMFLIDFAIRVFINPRFSPTLILGRLIVRNQVPEYVGARQKLFAWVIGLVLATTMFVLMVLLNTYSPITGIICLICLIFLYFETSFGICLGCLFYKWYYGKKAQYCPGEVCDVKARQPIQKTSAIQLIVLLAFILLSILIGFFCYTFFKVNPTPLFGG
jgi:hypothetical protein